MENVFIFKISLVQNIMSYTFTKGLCRVLCIFSSLAAVHFADIPSVNFQVLENQSCGYWL